ncbi:MAG: hypothetical protein ACLTTZ_02030 [Lachnospiraceae bacterium]
MTLSELLTRVPELESYIRYMPDELRDRCTVRTYPPGPSSTRRMPGWITSASSARLSPGHQ